MRSFHAFGSMAATLSLFAVATWCGCLSPDNTSPPSSDLDAAAPDASCAFGGCRDGSPIVDGAPAIDTSLDLPDQNSPANDARAGDAAGVVDSADATNPNDLFVDSALGADTNSGKSGSPFKTLAKAFSVATSGITVWVANGTYDAASEGSTSALTIPDGVTVRAANTGLAVLDALVVNASASATLNGLVFDKGLVFTANAALATSSSVTLASVQIKGGPAFNTMLKFGGNVKVAMTGPTFSGTSNNGVVTIGGAAEVVVTGGSLDGGNSGGAAFGGGLFSLTGTSKLTLDGVALRNTMSTAIAGNGSSATTPVAITLKNGALLDGVGSAGNCAAGAAIILTQNVTLAIDGSQIDNARSAAVCVRDGVADHVAVQIQNGASFTNDPSVIQSEPGQSAEATITVNGATMTSGIGAAINWSGTGSIDLQGVTMKNAASGIVTSSGSALSIHVRNSAITANKAYAVQAFSSVAGALTLDLGTAASPGGNTITGNATTGLDLHMIAGDTVNAVGNTWNASAEGADASGHYAPGTSQLGPTSTGANYQMATAQTLNL